MKSLRWSTPTTAGGFTLVELAAIVAIIAILAMLRLPGISLGQSKSKAASCAAIKGNIEVQAELWRHNTGSWPATNLSNIGGNVSYFPAGVATCPVDGSVYTIDAAGRVVGHVH